MPKWLQHLLGEHMPPPTVNVDIEDERRQAEAAKARGAEALAEVHRIRSASRAVHGEVTETFRRNHFAELMTRALEDPK
jgi:hypothetical protein